MVTGRISFLAPEYSPTSSSVSDVRRMSSSRHCRAATVLVTRMSVVALARAIAAAPTNVFPAPQGRTTTPEPPCQNPSAASFWYARSAHPVAEKGAYPLGAQHLLEYGPVGRVQDQAVYRVGFQAEPAVACHRLGDVDEQGVGHRVAGECQQRVDDLLGVVAGRAGVPESEWREPIGVDVLWRPLQLRERRYGATARVGLVMVDLEEQGLVALDDQWSVGHVRPSGRGPFIVPHGSVSRFRYGLTMPGSGHNGRRWPESSTLVPHRRRLTCAEGDGWWSTGVISGYRRSARWSLE